MEKTPRLVLKFQARSGIFPAAFSTMRKIDSFSGHQFSQNNWAGLTNQ
jgi:hypothetical protein